MKILICLLFTFASISSFGASLNSSVYEDSKVYCIKLSPGNGAEVAWDSGVSVSCVSKASINKDILERDVLLLQKEKLELELAKLRSTPDKKENKK